MRQSRRYRTSSARRSKMSVEALERRGMMAADAGLVMSVEVSAALDAEPDFSSISLPNAGDEIVWAEFVDCADGPSGMGIEQGMDAVEFACDWDSSVDAGGVAEAAAAGDGEASSMHLMELMMETVAQPLAASIAGDVVSPSPAPATGTVPLFAAWALFAVDGAVSETLPMKRGARFPRRG